MIYGLTLADILVLLAYFGVIVGIGIFTMHKVKGQGDFYVGGRRFGKFLVMMQGFGAGTSNTHPILVSSQVYLLGMAGIWYSWMYMLFTPFLFVLMPIIRRLRVYTVADFFDLRYGKGLGAFFSVSVLLNISLVIGTIILGLAQIVKGITDHGDGGMPKEYVIIAVTAVTLLYSMLGGLIAAAMSDVIQGVLIIVLSFILVPPMFIKAGGFAGIHAALPEHYFSLAMPDTGDPAKTIGLFAIFILFINGMLGNMTEGTVQLMQSAKDEKTLQWGAILGNLLKRTCTVGWALVGLLAAVIWPGLEPKEAESLFGRATQTFLPTGFSGLMIACMLAAGMGAASAFQVIASSIFSRNVYSKYIAKGKSDKHYLMVARLAGMTLVLSGLFVALRFERVTTVFELWMKLTAFLGPAMLIAIFWRRGTSWGAWASIISAFAVFLVTNLLANGSIARWFDHPAWSLDHKWTAIWYQAALYLPVGIAIYFIVSLLTKPEDDKKLDRFYARLNTPVGREHLLIATGLEPNPEEILSADGLQKLAEERAKAAAQQKPAMAK